MIIIQLSLFRLVYLPGYGVAIPGMCSVSWLDLSPTRSAQASSALRLIIVACNNQRPCQSLSLISYRLSSSALTADNEAGMMTTSVQSNHPWQDCISSSNNAGGAIVSVMTSSPYTNGPLNFRLFVPSLRSTSVPTPLEVLC